MTRAMVGIEEPIPKWPESLWYMYLRNLAKRNAFTHDFLYMWKTNGLPMHVLQMVGFP